tara:strand:- start:1659 stop:1991 length:333 start_codon:yes stop_codon:yes gene_type:complete
MSLLNVAIKLPKDYEDKKFEQILNDVEIGAIPTKFILELHIKLNNGQTVKVGPEFLKRVKSTEHIFEDTELQQFEDQVIDIDIYMNIDMVKSTVYKNVGKILAKYFKDGE